MATTNTSAAPAWANPTPNGNTPATIITDDEVNNVLLEPYSTLDEPVLETILRDVRAVGAKLKIVMLPLDRRYASPFGYMVVSSEETEESNEEMGENQKKVIDSLKDWDLWGPLVICLALSVILSFKAPSNESALVFASVFCLVWFGSMVVTINAQLLGGTISFFQSVCVLGYCVFPMTLAALIIGVLRLTPVSSVWFDLLWLCLGFVWATRSSSVFIAGYIPRPRRFLAVFPVLFFYTFLGWMILLF